MEHYRMTTYGFRRTPIPDQQRSIIKLPSPARSRLTTNNVYKATNPYNNNNNNNNLEHSSSHLDKKWLHNLQKIDHWLDRPKSVSLLSSQLPVQPNPTYSKIMPLKNQSANREKIKLRGTRMKYVECPRIACNSDKLNHDDLTHGQKLYLWNTARCYSVEQLKNLTTWRAKCLLDSEYMKRFVTTSVPDHVKENLWKEYCDYRIQIDKSVKSKRSAVSIQKKPSSKKNAGQRGESKGGDSKTGFLPSHPVIAEEVGEKSIDDNDDNDDNNVAEEGGQSPLLNQGSGIRRVRPKSAKYQKRGDDTSTARLSPSSSVEDELVFTAEDKLSLFEAVLNDEIQSSAKEEKVMKDNTQSFTEVENIQANAIKF